MSEFTALAYKEFQSLIVPGKNEFIYISEFVAITLICLLYPDLIDGLVLNAM